MIEVLNRQRVCKIDTKQFQEFGESALQAINPQSRDVTIVFVSDKAIRTLNHCFRGKDYPTDVLSFPIEAAPFEAANQMHLGDVVISLHRAQAQAKEHGLSFANEVKQLILHGLLHLCGYDHETDGGEMNRLELRLRRRLGI